MRKAVVVGGGGRYRPDGNGGTVGHGRVGKQQDKTDDEEEIENCEHLLDQRQWSAP